MFERKIAVIKALRLMTQRSNCPESLLPFSGLREAKEEMEAWCSGERATTLGPFVDALVDYYNRGHGESEELQSALHTTLVDLADCQATLAAMSHRISKHV